MSGLTEPAAEPPLPIRLRWRKRRRPLPARHLVDSRLFVRLTAPGCEEALAAFRESAVRHGLAGEGGLPPLELTPLAFLDAMGLAPPQVAPFPLPAEVLKTGESMSATTLVTRFGESRYRDFSELGRDALLKRAGRGREAAPDEARPLYEAAVGGFIVQEDFADQVVRQLAFDYLYRFPFPESLREDVQQFLFASLFATGDSVAGLSKMRAIKMLWDRGYPRLLKGNPDARGELQALDRQVKLRTRGDFLGWEPVHHGVLGSSIGERSRAVVSYVPGPRERAEARALAYKSALRYFLDQITPNDLATLRPSLNAWEPGKIVAVREDGGFEEPIETGGLGVYGAA